MFIFYRYFIGPLLHALGGVGFGCRFSPSCSHYAEEAFTTLPFFHALKVTVFRIFKCNPWISASYFDPVPPRRTF